MVSTAQERLCAPYSLTEPVFKYHAGRFLRWRKKGKRDSIMAHSETRNDIDPLAAAREQLEVAIELFLSSRSHASALTLPGAASGIFESVLKAKGEQSMLNSSFEAMDQTQKIAPRFGDISHDLPKDKRLEAFKRRKNLERDLLKHGPRKRNDNHYQRPRMHPDLEDAAYEMIVRADIDRESLGVAETNNRPAFQEWFYEHVVGV
jgi:hypothetical protein